MLFYRKPTLYSSLLIFLSACAVWNEPEEKIVGPVHYTHQVSIKEIEYEPGLIVPKSTISIAWLNYDSTTQISYTKSSLYKKYKGEYYLYSKSQIDTINLTKPDSTYIPTDYFISGNFKPPTGLIPNWRFEDRGIKFSSDGFCIHTTESSGSDTPMSATVQNKGKYRIAEDTIYISYFMTRSLFGSGYYKYDSTVKSIEDISWTVREPYEHIYLLSKTNDTLYSLTNSKNYYLIGQEGLERIE